MLLPECRIKIPRVFFAPTLLWPKNGCTAPHNTTQHCCGPFVVFPILATKQSVRLLPCMRHNNRRRWRRAQMARRVYCFLLAFIRLDWRPCFFVFTLESIFHWFFIMRYIGAVFCFSYLLSITLLCSKLNIFYFLFVTWCFFLLFSWKGKFKIVHKDKLL